MMLKYAGDMQLMVRSEFFTSEKYKEKFWYFASSKLPFYYMHKVSPPKLQTMMMDKYLENPVNPLMLIEYDQRDGSELRAVYVKEAYNKLKDNSFAVDSQLKGNLLCIGDPNIGKSYLLNKMFNLQFELN